MINSSTTPRRGTAVFSARRVLAILTLLFFLVPLSCANRGYKGSVLLVVESIMEGITKEELPVEEAGWSQRFGDIDPGKTMALRDSFRDMKDWKASVGKVRNNEVPVTIDIFMSDSQATLLLLFKNKDGLWVPQDGMEMRQTIDMIPLTKGKTSQ